MRRSAKTGAFEAASARHDSKLASARHMTVPKDGRIVIPADVREAIGLEPGGTVVAEVRDGALVIETLATRMRRLRELVRKFDKGTGSVVDEFIAERRAEAARE